jgi:hypothetical protein
MDFFSRINAVLHGEQPDRIPFAPYDNLMPRGEFVRGLRNRGMGLCARRTTITSHMPNVRVETWSENDDVVVTKYHTPNGDVTKRARTGLGRIMDSGSLELEGLISGVEDFEPAISMIHDMEFHIDNDVYNYLVRDMGSDVIFRDEGLSPEYEMVPYGATRAIFGEDAGLEPWVFAQMDHPDQFARLLRALTEKEEQRMELIAASPAEFIGFGWLQGVWGVDKIKKYELPFYKKWVPYLQSKGKIVSIHADAINLKAFKDLIPEIGVNVVEAFTPPPVGNLSIEEAREAWGPDVVIWINFPETIFWSGADATRQYTLDLLRSNPPGSPLVLGFTEMGLWSVTNEQTEIAFKAGTLAIMDAIDEYSRNS